jgi:Domain of unknown function (DUF1906)
MSVHLGADGTGSDVGQLKALGAEFISRYLSDFPAKNLTYGEAQTLTVGGIWIVSNWENDINDWQGGWNAGYRSATEAWRQHKACGGPDGRPIYFSVDMDADPTDSRLHAYFKGAGDALTPSQVDCYGSTAVILALRSAGLIRPYPSGWRTMSGGFRGGLGDPSEFAVEQTGYFNQTYDRDAALVDDYGQWMVGRVPGPNPPPAPAPVPVSPGGDLPTVNEVWAYKGKDGHRPDGDSPDVHQSLLDARDAAQACYNLVVQMKAELDAIKAKLNA